MSNPQQVQYIDRESGQLITTTSSSARRALQTELKTSIAERDITSQQLISITDSIALYDVKILDAQMGNETSRELGPLKYMAELTGMPMGSVVNWFMILIIFVFDPLAIAMVVAANMAFAHVKGVARDPKDYEIYKKPIVEEEWDEDHAHDMVLNQMVKEIEEPVVVEKIVEDPRMNHPRILEAIKHAKRAGEWD